MSIYYYYICVYISLPPNHPTTQPPNHPTTQPPNHPTTQPPNHPTTQPPNHPTTQPPNHPTTPPPPRQGGGRGGGPRPGTYIYIYNCISLHAQARHPGPPRALFWSFHWPTNSAEDLKAKGVSDVIVYCVNDTAVTCRRCFKKPRGARPKGCRGDSLCSGFVYDRCFVLCW